jgi:hypothetical protein
MFFFRFVLGDRPLARRKSFRLSKDIITSG